jgi:hypothetical protein
MANRNYLKQKNEKLVVLFVTHNIQLSLKKYELFVNLKITINKIHN